MLRPSHTILRATILRPALCATLLAAGLASPAMARDSLGIYDSWGAFRDPGAQPRCYAIAKANPGTARRDFEPTASVGTWPKRQIRNQIHFRLSRKILPAGKITLFLGGKRFALTGGGADAWAVDAAMDAAIVAAMRSAGSMSVSALDERGNAFTNTYGLAGAATALDAALLGCAKLR
ncbi:hypothetical protein NT2_02_04330 [Caenibius tardaugens NBRC 16725]|uniref:Invasion associated locus B family protein n=1 Tax=Caenibius tardaugens NBRC 16725 TaxID=1219035 RepID=U2Y5G0_9SPHN|nr:hypothetical protein NT2_02_04330 [Caenibius tardaugens NBRC 16725]